MCGAGESKAGRRQRSLREQSGMSTCYPAASHKDRQIDRETNKKTEGRIDRRREAQKDSRNSRFRKVLQGIDPPVPDSIRELFLLPPEDFIRQIVVLRERRPDGPLLDLLRVSLLDHLELGVYVHRQFQKVPVQKRGAGLETPRLGRLIRPQTVVQVEGLQFADCLPVELLLVGGLVEVQVPSEDLVCPLSADHRLHPDRFDLPRQEVHRGRRPDRRHVVSLQMINHVSEGVEAFLDRERETEVVRSQKFGHLLRCLQVRRARQSDGEALQLLQPGSVCQLLGGEFCLLLLELPNGD
mmetsp:Transcript_36035/g.70907  ORF Transcript_36035/g.70907 Transcript_36035/m.70907 type:complete len:297 (-) Transcript_36035:953-1843(-)